MTFWCEEFIPLAISLSRLLLLVLSWRDIRRSDWKSWKVPVAVPQFRKLTCSSTAAEHRSSLNCLTFRLFRYLKLRVLRTFCLESDFPIPSFSQSPQFTLALILLFCTSVQLFLLSFAPFAFLVNQTTFSQTREREDLFSEPQLVDGSCTSRYRLFSFGSIVAN